MVGAERIEGLSVLFAAGVALGAILSVFTHNPFLQTFLLSATVFLLLAAELALPHRRPWLILVIYFTAGILCLQTADIGSCCRTGTMDPITCAATSSAKAVKGTIDRIPYEDSETAGLVKALVTGDRSGISKETRDIFRSSGASHILALSGLHLGILYMLLMWAGSVFGNSPGAKLGRCIGIIAVTGFYALATGASPSVVRAFLFISINEILKYLGRKKKPASVLCIALFIQLTINPLIIRSVGFQLSYMAMCGIVLLFPALESWYPREIEKRHKPTLSEKADVPRRIWQAAALSISCQVFTAPVSWYYFRSFPTYFLITNLLAMPVTSGVMVLSVGSILLTALGICPGFLVVLNEKAVRLLVWILTVISQL